MNSDEIKICMKGRLLRIIKSADAIVTDLAAGGLPNIKNFENMALDTAFLNHDHKALAAELEMQKQNTDKGLCPFLSVQYNACKKACGGCPTPEWLDCGGREFDGHPAHIGPCKNLIPSIK